MAAGIGDRLWSMEEVVAPIGAVEVPAKARKPYEARRPEEVRAVNGLTAFGLFAVTAMLVTYALEARSAWFILAFAGSCLLGSTYGFLQGAWPFGVVEAVWTAVALNRWRLSSPD